MKKLNVSYNYEKKRVTFYLGSIFEKKIKHRGLTERELKTLCDTISHRIIFKHIGTVMPQYFGFSYWSEY